MTVKSCFQAEISVFLSELTVDIIQVIGDLIVSFEYSKDALSLVFFADAIELLSDFILTSLLSIALSYSSLA
jgi:hypothetical protein